jgi:hypothetical protein
VYVRLGLAVKLVLSGGGVCELVLALTDSLTVLTDCVPVLALADSLTLVGVREPGLPLTVSVTLVYILYGVTSLGLSVKL